MTHHHHHHHHHRTTDRWEIGILAQRCRLSQYPINRETWYSHVLITCGPHHRIRITFIRIIINHLKFLQNDYQASSSHLLTASWAISLLPSLPCLHIFEVLIMLTMMMIVMMTTITTLDNLDYLLSKWWFPWTKNVTVITIEKNNNQKFVSMLEFLSKVEHRPLAGSTLRQPECVSDFSAWPTFWRKVRSGWWSWWWSCWWLWLQRNLWCKQLGREVLKRRYFYGHAHRKGWPPTPTLWSASPLLLLLCHKMVG